MSSHERALRLFRIFTRLDGMGEEFFATAASKAGDRDLSRARGELLRQIQISGGRLQVQDIAERTGRTKSASAELAAKLCRDGYAFKLRVAGDGRGVWVVLSGKGRRAVALYSRISADLDRSIAGILTDREAARLAKLELQLESLITEGKRS